MASVKTEGARLSVHQAGTTLRRIHNSDFSDHYQSFSKLVALFLEFYFLETKPLSYEVRENFVVWLLSYQDKYIILEIVPKL